MFKKLKEFRNKRPVLTMIAGYTFFWLLLCVVFTMALGNRELNIGTYRIKASLEKRFRDTTEILKERVTARDFSYENDKGLLQYTMQALLSDVSLEMEGDVEGLGYCWIYDWEKAKPMVWFSEVIENELSTEQNDLVFLIRHPDDVYYRKEVLSCPKSYFTDVINETFKVKKNERTQWSGGSSLNCWRIQLLEGYRKGNEFRPGKVVVTYLIQDKEDERRYEAANYKIIDCAHGVVPEGFEEMEFRVFESGKTVPETIFFPQDTDNWKELSLEDIKAVPNDDLYAEGIGEFFSQSETEAKTVSTGYSVFAQRSTKTFSVFNTDMCITYIDDIPAANSKHIRLFMFYSLKDCLQVYRRDFFKSMLWYYLGFALFFALLAWYNYRRFYSLQGKNRFHKSLINSMAHDLKSPLMVMQGFSENLKENVHSEKKEYYSEEIFNNVQYLNGLIDKNLSFSKKNDFESADEDNVYLSDLVDRTVARYKEKMDEKNLKVRMKGDSFLKGDPDILGLILDNLISNAIKYTLDGEVIDVVGKNRSFSVGNKAILHYKKNLQHLLDPLEMGEESRTAGAGTGLGLSIANGIVQERGCHMKLSYNKKTKYFVCKVILSRWF
ncbi:MAG: HAMP domain-containing histidine kinase [Lachnospiraceae bacterium]|nr:HAMP domain-containing histidine kinase [Lachnospiraceae bacterium]